MNSAFLERRFARAVSSALADLLGEKQISSEVEIGESTRPNLIARVGNRVFIVECKANASSSQVGVAIERLRGAAKHDRRMVPLVAVPYMGEVGRRLCENADIGWIDLSGNALIRAKDLFVRVEGRPNRFKTAGRPPDVFAPKSARIARWLLMHPDEAWTQRELARSTGMDEGFVSRIVKRLAVADLVSRDESGRVRSRDANLLLDAWAETYRFENHTILKGHVAARSGEDLVNTVADRLGSAKLRYAATGLAAAWLYCRFASFRLASFYLAEEPTADLPDRIGFREDPRGANLWLVLPKDMGVFQETRVIRDVTCVHPVQVYLDLAGHPERAPEAAERLRADFLKPGAHD